MYPKNNEQLLKGKDSQLGSDQEKYGKEKKQRKKQQTNKQQQLQQQQQQERKRV